VPVFWLAVAAAAGPLSGKLMGADKNDARSWLPSNAESTRLDWHQIARLVHRDRRRRTRRGFGAGQVSVSIQRSRRRAALDKMLGSRMALASSALPS
jgi:hypothetical protein